MDLALSWKLRPALPRDHVRRARLLIPLRFQNREMRNIGPTLLAAQPLPAKLVVQFTHPISSPLYLDEHRRSRRQKGFHVSQFDVERDDASTSLFQKFQSDRFGSRQLPRRKAREMGRQVSRSRVEFPTQFFHELANRIADARHQRLA